MDLTGGEITVLSSGGFKSALLELAPRCEQTIGRRLDLSFGPANLLKKQIDDGKAFDVAILTRALIDDLVRDGKIAGNSAVPVARTGLALAVRLGAPKPDISSVEAFKRALIDAKSIAYTTTGQSGLHFARVIETLGIAAAVNARAKTIPGGAAGELVASGQAEMAVQLIPELMAVPGTEIVGPFPAELQNYLVLTAGIGAKTADEAAARALIACLSAPAAAPVIAAKGMQPV